MTFPILGANGAVGGYSIDNSLRFNDGDSPRLDRTSVSSPTDSKIFTYSVWLKKTSIGSNFTILDARSGTNRSQILFRSGSNDAIRIVETSNNFSSFDTLITTNALYRDVSAWYNLLIKYDSTNGTANNRCLIYVNGVEQSLDINTSVTLNYTTPLNEGNYTNDLGHADGAELYDGYIAEAHFIDGQALTPTDFGEFDEDSGIWKPIEYTGTYGTNGFYLDFENSGSLGADQSGNGNNFTPTNLASTDQMLDTPTNNWCTLNVLDKDSNPVLSEGNLKITTSTTNVGVFGNFGVSQGKWYFEFVRENSSNVPTYGVALSSWIKTYVGFTNSIGYHPNGYIYNNGSQVQSGLATCTTGDIIGIKLDLDAGSLTFFKNNVQIGTPITGLSGEYFPAVAGQTSSISVANFGQDSSFAGNEIRQNNSDENGYGDFYYAPPSGYLALCTQNLATTLSPTIDDGSQYFNTVLWTGNSTYPRSITGVGFQPDLIWAKTRNQAYGHLLQDVVRGTGSSKGLYSSSSGIEGSFSVNHDISSFDTDGFTISQPSSTDVLNTSGNTHVAWNWKAGGTGVTNTNGSITSTVSANTTAGLSIVTYTGTASSSTAGHGLNSTPEIIISKARNATQDWAVHTTIIDGSMDFLVLNNTNAKSDSSFSLPTSTVFPTRIGNDYVAYIFHSVEGYSKFDKYTGNGSTDGAFVYTGFRPSFVLTKRTDTSGYSWGMVDSKRSPYNQANEHLFANAVDAEYTTLDKKDLLSNGFKHRTNLYGNLSGGTYIYMAFAEHPFVTSGGLPVTAR